MNNKEKLAKQILKILSKQYFADWYMKGRFDHWIAGDLPSVPENEILNDIVKLFELDKITL